MTQYLQLLDDVLWSGTERTDRTGTGTISAFGKQLRHRMDKGFPLLTTKKLHLKSIIYELLWFLKGDTNTKHLKEHGVSIWDEWADDTGSIGKAYGYQIAQKHIYKEGDMNQIDRVLYDLRHNPYSRRIITNIYVHSDLHEMNLYPCAYSVIYNVTDEGYDKLVLNAVLTQRSQDVLAANNWNVCQYSILLMMIAQSVGMIPGKLLHVIADAHIYDRHVLMVKELINRLTYKAPEVKLNPDIHDFYKFTTDDLFVKDYVAGPQIKNIPIAV